MKSAGIFGGTFDPIHNGHLITARAVLEIRKLDKIIFIPANISPHKTDKTSSSAEHRLKMVQKAVAGIPYFEVSDNEVNAGGISYAIDTLKLLKEKYKRLELIIGYDNLNQFHTWRDPDEIIKLAELLVIKRRIEEHDSSGSHYAKDAVFLNTPVIEISATDIRRRVQNGLPINFLVPEKVMEYIYNFNLYR